MEGKILMNKVLDSEGAMFSISNFPPGVYCVNINSDKELHIMKIIKK